ncbi:MAG: HEAT repeat domain-containing protein [Synechococcales bacterium]|nr:HEAT repeat domain-containing protein [Synechococcales bacterium]
MNLEQIKTSLASPDPQDRMRGITALRQFEPEVAAPILLAQINDPEMIVRSLVVMGLGFKQSATAFDQLLEVMQHDAEANIRAEAAGALAKYGKIAVPHLVNHFYQDQHWLSQISIILALPDLDCPDQFLQVVRQTLQGTETAILTTAIEQLPSLLGTCQESEALDLLLDQVASPQWAIRRSTAIALQAFRTPRAQAALFQLRQDGDHRVVAATLEMLIA